MAILVYAMGIASGCGAVRPVVQQPGTYGVGVFWRSAVRTTPDYTLLDTEGMGVVVEQHRFAVGYLSMARLRSHGKAVSFKVEVRDSIVAAGEAAEDWARNVAAPVE